MWVARRPPGFGFVEMEDRQDAEEAVRLFQKVGLEMLLKSFSGEDAGWGQDCGDEDQGASCIQFYCVMYSGTFPGANE